MIRYFSVLVFVVMLTSLSGCRELSVMVEPPLEGRVSALELELKGEVTRLLVEYPEAGEPKPFELLLSLERSAPPEKKRRSGPRRLPKRSANKATSRLHLSTRSSSPYLIDSLASTEKDDQSWLLIRLAPNHRSLPPFRPVSEEGSFNSSQLKSGVGRVFVWRSFEKETGEVDANSCNAFLVGERYAITNSHCLSEESLCPRSFMVFSSEPNNPYAYQCDRILYINRAVDQVLFSLRNPPIDRFQILPIQRASYYYPEGTKINVLSDLAIWIPGFNKEQNDIEWKTELWEKRQIAGEITGELRTVAVPVSRQDGEIAAKSGATKMVSYRTSCDVIGGQSGSPVLATTGEVLGVVWAKEYGSPTEPAPAVFSPLDSKLIAALEEAESFAFDD